MTKEELLERINKCEAKVVKINNRIAKWSIGLSDEALDIAKEYGLDNHEWSTQFRKDLCAKYREYRDSHTNCFNHENWNKGPNIDETMRAYQDLRDVQNTINKYKIALDKIVNFENQEKIPALVEFLAKWRELAYSWYLENAKKYFELKKNYHDAKIEWEQSIPEDDWRRDKNGKINWGVSSQWESDYYSSIDKLTQEITRVKGEYRDRFAYNSEYIYTSYTVDTDKLNKYLDKEVTAKYKDLVERVTKVTGTITDASNLTVANNGSINGVIVGEKAKARLETIIASGPIQCTHYRVLIHKYN